MLTITYVMHTEEDEFYWQPSRIGEVMGLLGPFIPEVDKANDPAVRPKRLPWRGPMKSNQFTHEHVNQMDAYLHDIIAKARLTYAGGIPEDQPFCDPKVNRQFHETITGNIDHAERILDEWIRAFWEANADRVETSETSNVGLTRPDDSNHW